MIGEYEPTVLYGNDRTHASLVHKAENASTYEGVPNKVRIHSKSI